MKKKEPKLTGTGSLQFGKGRIVKMWETEVSMDDFSFKSLKEFGMREIVKDDVALISYAVNKAMKAGVEKMKNGELK